MEKGSSKKEQVQNMRRQSERKAKEMIQWTQPLLRQGCFICVCTIHKERHTVDYSWSPVRCTQNIAASQGWSGSVQMECF